jgi:hypothetical protein
LEPNLSEELRAIIDAEFVDDGALARALDLVSLTGGLGAARKVGCGSRSRSDRVARGVESG